LWLAFFTPAFSAQVNVEIRALSSIFEV